MKHRHISKEGVLLSFLGLVLCAAAVVYLYAANNDLLPGTSNATPAPVAACKPQSFLTGVAYPQWSPSSYGSKDMKWQEELPAIRTQTAACWLEMPILFSQDSQTSYNVRPGASTPTVANFTYGIRAAHDQGYHIFITPLVGVKGPQTWVGYVTPQTYEDQQQWFDSYWQTFKPYAMAAAQEGVEQLSIGTEEEWLQNNAPDALWNQLIANIRSVFPGTLTYDSNWSQLETPPAKWMQNADLKMIGVSAYMALVWTTPQHVDPNQIAAMWKENALPLLDNYAITLGKPIFLSEVGYRNSSDALYHSWESTSTAPADPEEQAAACDAVLANSISDPHILGSFFWGWDDVGGFTLKGQPAATVLHNRYAPLQA